MMKVHLLRTDATIDAIIQTPLDKSNAIFNTSPKNNNADIYAVLGKSVNKQGRLGSLSSQRQCDDCHRLCVPVFVLL